MNDLNGKKVVVLGGTSGIGRAVKEIAAAQGADVFVASRRTGVDITDSDSLKQYFTAIGNFDHLVITAGSSAPSGAFVDLDLTEVKGAFETKLWGSVQAVQLASRHINTGGSVTLTSGFLSRRTVVNTWPKTVINAAIEACVKLLAKELSPVRVNGVSPGLTNTEAHAAMTPESRQTMFDKAAETLPAKYVAKAQDLASGYLLCMLNPAMTGAVLDIDNGALIN